MFRKEEYFEYVRMHRANKLHNLSEILPDNLDDITAQPCTVLDAMGDYGNVPYLWHMPVSCTRIQQRLNKYNAIWFRNMF